MMTLILYDDWLTKANEKIKFKEDGKWKTRPRMTVIQIKELLRLCVTADKAEFLSNGTLYQFN